MRFDVVIVGAGPSGAVCALELARKGFSVAIVERMHFPRRKVCGEYLNCGSLKHLAELGLSARFEPLFHPLCAVALHAAGATLQLRFPQAAASLPREQFDEVLLDEAKAVGVQLIAARVSDLVFKDDRVSAVVVEGKEGVREIGARFVVGADGCGSLVARKLGVVLRPKRAARYAMGGHFQTLAAASDTLEMRVKNGQYLALNPLGKDRANIMLVMRQNQFRKSAGRPDAWLVEAAKTFGVEGDLVGQEHRIGDRVAVGPLTHNVSSAAGRGILLIGDAAGFLSPFTGQGVFLALSSARKAADAIAAICASPQSETQEFAAYAADQKHDRRARSRLSGILDRLSYAPFAARRIMRHVQTHDAVRDELMRVFCGLSEPSIVRGARLFLGATV